VNYCAVPTEPHATITRVCLVLAVALAAPCAGAQEPVLLSAHELKQLSVDQLMNLEVTSVSRRPEKLQDVASAIQVITRDEIVRSGATNLPEALRLASNLQVVQVDARQWAITARGFNSTGANKLQVLIDGRTVYTPLYSGVFWDAQETPLADIERIEVISGPGATLWGANAVNGVINITTRHSQETQGLRVQASAGSAPLGAGQVRYGGSVDTTLHFRVYGDEFTRPQSFLPNGKGANDEWRSSQGGFRADWDRSASERVTLQGDVYSGDISQPSAIESDLSGANVLGRWSREYSAASSMTLQLYYDRTHRYVPGGFEEELQTWDLDFQRRFSPGARHDVLWGLGYRLTQDTVTNSAGLAFLPSVLRQQLFTGFLQDDITLVADRLNLALGTKVEHNDYTGFEVQPSVRLAWRLHPKQTLWTAVSRAVRTPSRIDHDFFTPGKPPFILDGGPGIQSEKVVSYELGYRAQPSEAFALSLATFTDSWDDLRSVHIANLAPLRVIFANGYRGVSRGAELTADYHVTDKWQLHAGYTQLYVHIEPKPGSTDVQLNGAEIFDPDKQALVRSSADLPMHLTFDVDYRYVGKIAVQSLPDYEEMDSRLAWRAVPRLELSVAGRNLLHDRHVEFGIGNARRFIERSVYAQLAWGF